jgi:hypothetical protein
MSAPAAVPAVPASPSSPANILAACADPALFGRWFANPKTWTAWFAFLRAMFGLPMARADRKLFTACTSLRKPLARGYLEAWLVCGRRAGKSLMLALIAVFLACYGDYSPYLTPGERGIVLIIAADKKQAAVIFKYIAAFLRGVPMLAALIERETASEIDLTNGITIEIATASYRTVRGRTLIACLADEIAFWRTDEGAANPDSEILAAIRPAMATIPGAMLLCASSPYSRRGELWNAYRRYHGKPGPVLVWKAETRRMNPLVPQRVIDDAMERDAPSARAEFLAEFRSDIEAFVTREVIEAVTVPGRRELLPLSDIAYSAFVDPSGGSSDSMTLCIAHRDRWSEKAVIDAIREVKPPFSPDDVVCEFSELLKSYRISRVTGDRYAGEWPRERFRAYRIEYLPADRPKSDLYRDLLPQLNGGAVELPDHPRLAAQLCSLERRTARGGRDSIDHPPGGHDDLANVVAGAVVGVVVNARAPFVFATIEGGVYTAASYAARGEAAASQAAADAVERNRRLIAEWTAAELLANDSAEARGELKRRQRQTF